VIHHLFADRGLTCGRPSPFWPFQNWAPAFHLYLGDGLTRLRRPLRLAAASTDRDANGLRSGRLVGGFSCAAKRQGERLPSPADCGPSALPRT